MTPAEGELLPNAKRFAEQYSDRIWFVPALGWLRWDDQRWKPSDKSEILPYVHKASAGLRLGPRNLQDRFWVETALKQAEQFLVAPLRWFDQDPYLLNLQNGTLDLRTMELRPHSRRDFITKLAPVRYDPRARAPRWDEFLDMVFITNTKAIEFLQKCVGYALTGDTCEGKLFVLLGKDFKEKSIFLQTMIDVLGDYASHVRWENERYDYNYHEHMLRSMGGLRGVRFVVVRYGIGFLFQFERAFAYLFEHWDAPQISGLGLNDEGFTFKLQAKFFVEMEYMPGERMDPWDPISFSATTYEKLCLIPFNVNVGIWMQEFQDRFSRERSGILNWALKGYQLWKKDGLGELLRRI